MLEEVVVRTTSSTSTGTYLQNQLTLSFQVDLHLGNFIAHVLFQELLLLLLLRELRVVRVLLLEQGGLALLGPR